MGLGRFELPTPRLSSVCSDQLSYRPDESTAADVPVLSKLERTPTHAYTYRAASTTRSRNEYQIDLEVVAAAEPRKARRLRVISRKEVIQPQVLLQLPCYDFTPITNHTFGACLPCGLARRLLVQPAFVM